MIACLTTALTSEIHQQLRVRPGSLRLAAPALAEAIACSRAPGIAPLAVAGAAMHQAAALKEQDWLGLDKERGF